MTPSKESNMKANTCGEFYKFYYCTWGLKIPKKNTNPVIRGQFIISGTVDTWQTLNHPTRAHHGSSADRAPGQSFEKLTLNNFDSSYFPGLNETPASLTIKLNRFSGKIWRIRFTITIKCHCHYQPQIRALGRGSDIYSLAN